jgi:hypothetical protein
MASARISFFMGKLRNFDAGMFGSNKAAPEHYRLFGFHIAHVMAFMA